MRLTQAATPQPPQPQASTSQTSQQRWSSIQSTVQARDDGSSTTTESPPMTLLDADQMGLYGANATDPVEVIRCRDCSKPILESAAEAHAANCAAVRERQRKSVGGTSDPAAVARKRQVSEGSQDAATSPEMKPKPSLILTLGEPSDKKKKVAIKDSAPSKAAVARGIRRPVDPDKQCGVINDKGYPCSRSLTCKSHSMGAKRSVSHRSQPYDILLYEMQKTTKPEFGNRKPVQPRVGPGSEAYGATLALGGKKKRKSESGGGRREKTKMSTMIGEWDDSGGEEGFEGMIDSEEELEGVQRGLAKAGRGRPLGMVGGGGGAGFSSGSLFVERNVKMARLREVLGGVFGVSNVSVR